MRSGRWDPLSARSQVKAKGMSRSAAEWKEFRSMLEQPVKESRPLGERPWWQTIHMPMDKYNPFAGFSMLSDNVKK